MAANTGAPPFRPPQFNFGGLAAAVAKREAAAAAAPPPPPAAAEALMRRTGSGGSFVRKLAAAGAAAGSGSPPNRLAEYTLGVRLGGGAFGQVFAASRRGTPDAAFAIKLVRKDKYDAEDVVLRGLNHPNVVPCLESFLAPSVPCCRCARTAT